MKIMIPCIVLAGPIGLGFGYMRQIENLVVLTLKNVNTGDMLFGMWNSYILWSFAWCFSTVGYLGHSALEKRLLYDSIIMDEHFKGQRCACSYFLTPSRY
ncbi:hypothetical protein LOK49_LG01G01242 [Camellia lanceoleosa]|uniref:Uncharacterized protein n=1 Tax=Camellia lanceoleosa TaxID=1840588 RepID=A0ACC0IRX1_9ERIC|nr:hypothetical protein LOK49_LG01G01242 [Camellia lanceoleosa]